MGCKRRQRLKKILTILFVEAVLVLMEGNQGAISGEA
jgi:hypothetical protein